MEVMEKAATLDRLFIFARNRENQQDTLNSRQQCLKLT